MLKKQLTNKRGKWQVIVYASDKYTVEYLSEVISTICGHGYMQSLQCAMIIEQVGSYAVFEDTYDECEQVLEEFEYNDLIAKIRKKHVTKNKK